mgnify:CR=1 FL=1
MKKKIIIITNIICIICLLAGTFVIINNKKNELPSVILQNDLTVEKGKIISKDDYIDTSTPGKQKITITIENNYNKKRDYTFYIEVVNN